MAKFRFQFEPVLFQRRAEEDSCQRDLAKSLRTRMILCDQLRQLQQDITVQKRQLSGALVGRVDMERVAHFACYSGQTTHRAHTLVVRLAGVEKQIEAARLRLLEATRARKAMEILRDRRYQQWKTQIERREVAQLDELAVQWHGRTAALEGRE